MRRHRPAIESTEDRKESKRWYARKPWQTLRRSKLRQNPFCELCLVRDIYTPATDVHHKTDRRKSQDKALDLANLQSLCKVCHSRITGERSRSPARETE